MDTNNWPNQGGTTGGDSAMESVDWKSQLSSDYLSSEQRQKIANKIIGTLKKQLSCGSDEHYEIDKLALKFEEKIYTTATSQADYLRKISLKLMNMETKSANPNSLQSNSSGSSVKPSDPGSHGMQKVKIEGQSLPIHVPSQQISSSALTPGNSLSQSTMQQVKIEGQSLPIHVPSQQISSSALPPGNSLSQSIQQVKIEGQQLPIHVPSNHPQSSQQISSSALPPGNSLSNSTMQQVKVEGQSLPIHVPANHPQSSQQISSSSLPPGNSLSQSTMQQVKNESQPLPIHVPSSNHPQSSQQVSSSALTPGNSLSQSTMSNITTTQNPSFQNIQNISRVQAQHSSIGNNMPNSFVNQKQIPGRQPQPQQSQNSQHLFYQHQLHQIAKHNLQQNFSATSAQSHIQQHHQNLMQSGVNFQPSSLSTLQQNQQQSALRQQRQQQQQQRVVSQQSNLSNIQKTHPHSVGQQNTNFSAMHQQQHMGLGPQSSSQLLGTQPQHSTHVMQMQSKVSITHQNQAMKPELHQKVIPPLQTQLNMKQQPNMSQREMQQKQAFQQQRAMPEASSTSSDSTAQTGHPNSGDWQEEVYQKLKAMKEKYMPELKELYQKIVCKLQQLNSLPQQPKSEQFEKMKQLKQLNEHWMQFLQVSKTKITPAFKDKLSLYEKQILNLISTYNKPKPGPTHTHTHNHLQPPQTSSTMFQIHMHQQFLQKQQLLQQQQQQQQKTHHHQVTRHNTVTKPQLQVNQQQQQLPHTLQRLKSGPTNIDQLTSVTKSGTGTGTTLQSVNSPFTMSSPSTPSTSHVVGDSEKVVNSGVLSVANQSNVAMLPPTPIATPGISASPLLAEFASVDENQGNDASVVVSGKSSSIEQPLEHLLKVVKSISAKSLSASVSDIGSVVSMIDSIAGSGPSGAGNAPSNASIGEDLVATTKCRLEGKITTTETRKMKRILSSLNVVSSASSVNDSFIHFNGLEASELESTATSMIKRPRTETSNALLEEIRGINRGLIDTKVDIDANSDVSKGTVVKCLFGAVAFGPNITSQYASPKVSPIQPLRLLVPVNYPNCSPVLLDKFPVEVSKEYEDLSVKAKWRFHNCVRTLSDPMSLEEMARTWDVCARAVFSEYAQQTGGGTFTSKYGAWEDCLV